MYYELEHSGCVLIKGVESCIYIGATDDGIIDGCAMTVASCDRLRLDVDQVVRRSIKPSLLFNGYRVRLSTVVEAGQSTATASPDALCRYLTGRCRLHPVFIV